MLIMMRNIMIFLKFLCVFTVVTIVNCKDDPQFAGPETNVTVVVGRDATLTCKLENLQSYKVAWLRVDTQTVLTIGSHVITKNHRVSVSHGDPQTWGLTVRDVRATDGGHYMCQINTEPMITQTHLLQVVVPPDINDVGSSGSEVMMREGDNVTLHCAASGSPAPNITWRREDSAPINVDGKNVIKWSGTWLNMSALKRESNGAFLCIATNGVPPSVSKRILLHVLCKPSVKASQKMVGGYIGSKVILQCKIEGKPTPSVYWTHIDNNKLQYDNKYQAIMKSDGYRHVASLSIRNLSREDIGTYYCNVDNVLGKAMADITLYTLATTTTSTTTTTAETTTALADITTSQISQEAEIEDENTIKVNNKKLTDEDDVVVVLSQHQMQMDFSPSS